MKSFLEICKESDLSDGFLIWENVAKNISELIETGKLRMIVENDLPELNLSEIEGDIGAIQRVYTMTTFIAHGYIRGGPMDDTLTKLPCKIASIWIESSKLLRIPPVATYSATVLFNFKLKGELRTAEDFEILFTFTGTEDEKWFYAVSAAIDIESVDILRIANEIRNNKNSCDLNSLGKELAEKIRVLTGILNRMYERCRPEVFYNRVRKYLAGWFKDPKFQEVGGLVYVNKDNSIVLNLAGGSAAQNPTIQLLDVLLGVKHDEMRDDESDLSLTSYNGVSSGGCVIDYLGAMRTYMPPEHAQFLNELEADLKSSKVIEIFKKTEGFSDSVKALADFRSEHIKMVTRYVICESSRLDVKGTGGSNPIPFLKKCRFDTEKVMRSK